MKSILTIAIILVLGSTSAAQENNKLNFAKEVTNKILKNKPQSAEYEVIITSLWNKREHLSVPQTAHFSPFVVTVHNEGHRLFPKGEFANAGLELVAELGRTSVINNEIFDDIDKGSVLSSLNTEDQFVLSTKVQKIKFTATTEYALVSLVSMIAPSPDWIVGVDSLSLFDGEKFLENSGTMNLYAYNAGTEDGDFGGNYSINNSPTTNPTPIERLQGRGFDSPFATIKFRKLSSEK